MGAGGAVWEDLARAGEDLTHPVNMVRPPCESYARFQDVVYVKLSRVPWLSSLSFLATVGWLWGTCLGLFSLKSAT